MHCSQIDGLEQDCSNSSALAMALLQSCTKPSKYSCRLFHFLERPSHGEMSHKWCFGRRRVADTCFWSCSGYTISVSSFAGTYRLRPECLRTLPLRRHDYCAECIILRITYSTRLMFPLGSSVNNLQLYTPVIIFTVGQWFISSWIVVAFWQLPQVEVALHVSWIDYLIDIACFSRPIDHCGVYSSIMISIRGGSNKGPSTIRYQAISCSA